MTRLPRSQSGPFAPWRPLLLFAIAFLFQLATQDRRVGVYDEGLVLLGAERVFRGELPYRDFWAMYPPGQFYLLSWLFHGFGPSVLTERVWDAIVRAGISVIAYRLLRRTSSRTMAVACCAIVSVWLSGLDSSGFPIFPALLGSLAAVDLLAPRFYGRMRPRGHAAAGACVGLATLFRHDLGLYTAVAFLVILGFHSRRSADPGTRRLAPLTLFAGGGLAVTVPVLVWLLRVAPARDLWFGMIEAPMRNYPRVRSLPFPSWIDIIQSVARDGNIGYLDHLAVHLPILVGVTTIAAFVVAERHDARADTAVDPQVAGTRWTLLLLGTLGLLFFIKGMVRISPIHLAPAIVTSIVALLALGAPALRLPKALGLARILCWALLIAATLPIVSVTWDHAAETANRLARGDAGQTPPGLERLRGFDLDPDRIRAIQYVQEHSRPGDYVYVGTVRHDRILVNDIAFNFIANRRTPTRWHHFEPGVQTTAPVQNEIVRELSTHAPPLVVLSAEWEEVWEPNASRLSSGVTILDRFLAERYEPAVVFGPIVVLKRRAP